jgi:hypothetical protein
MSVRDIILDRVKERLFYDLHGKSLIDRISRVTPRTSRVKSRSNANPPPNEPPLKRWNIEYVSDIIDLTIANNRSKIDPVIDEIFNTGNLSLTDLNDDIIEKIVEKIEPIVLILDDQQKRPYVGENAPTIKPAFPFNTKSLLQMCWGMTLNFSHETQQQALGAMFNNQFSDEYKQIFVPRLTANPDDPNSIFLMNLQMAIASTIRNLGFIRITHSEYLNFNADRLSGRRQNLEEIADLASFNDAGLFTKIGSFIGLGSATTIAGFVSGLGLSVILVPLFAAGGIGGALLVTIGVRVYVNRTDDSWDRKMRQEQNRYWKEHYMKDVTNELYDLYVSIIGLIDKFYPENERDAIINNDELLKHHEYPDWIKTVIREDILPPGDLQWFPFTQAAINQPSTSDSKGSDKST